MMYFSEIKANLAKGEVFSRASDFSGKVQE